MNMSWIFEEALMEVLVEANAFPGANCDGEVESDELAEHTDLLDALAGEDETDEDLGGEEHLGGSGVPLDTLAVP